MKKLLGIVVLGLLWCNFSYAENITLIKCKDVGDKKMDRSKEKYYFTIDYKSNEVTEVWIYTNEWVASMKKAKEETGLENMTFNKTAIIKRKIFHKDKVIVNAKSKKEFIEAIEYSEATIDLEKFIVSTSYKLYNKKQSKYVLDNSSQVQCSLKK
jgi:hypothetical protein